MRVALITGITGQDGSYLAELLLEKGYKVYGIIRRASSFNTKRIKHILKNKNLILEYGDMTDSINITAILKGIKKSNKDMERLELYNLAAMSHVKVSFDIPEHTVQTDGVGVLRILEAIRQLNLADKTRFYQASTSELYGKVQEIPQTEKTPFYPRSPYAVAKLYGFWITKNYRESYNMYACNGILFNHETVAGFMPLIFKQDGMVDIKPISEIVRYHTGVIIDEKKLIYQGSEVNKDLYVWDNSMWTKVSFASGYPHDTDKPKHPKMVVSKNSCFMATSTHIAIMDDGMEKEVKDIKVGDRIKLVDYPEVGIYMVDYDEAHLLGMIVAYSNKNKQDESITNKIYGLWHRICKKYVGCSMDMWVEKHGIYNEDGTKRIPMVILNSSKDIMESFMDGYGRNLRTDSATLAAGLVFIMNRLGGGYSIDVDKIGKKFIYCIKADKGEKNSSVYKILNCDDYDGWFYDLETNSGTFQCGIGQGIVHNSPRRGPTFVTRKITRALGKIIKGKQDKLVLGNLDAKRDWGHAKDYVYGMWLILQADKPDDYVLSTNEYHSVREFVEKSFALKGYNIEWKGEGVDEVGIDKKTGKILIQVSERYFRPAEVDELLGDSSKARKELMWKVMYSFDDLIKDMVDGDCS